MFTVCPKCALTLVVTAADLRIAQGYVRCGRCLNVFNALARLSEERPAAAPENADAAAAVGSQETTPAPPPPPAISDDAAENTGEIEVELEASSVLVTAVHTPASPVDGAEPPQTQGATHLEMRVETHVDQPAPAAPAASASHPAVAVAPLMETAAQKESEAPAASAGVLPAAEAQEAQQTNTLAEQSETGFELETRRQRAGLVWTLGVCALAIALALQLINHYRDALAANPALTGPMSAVYSALGVKLAPRWDIHAYDVRQLGASVTGTATGKIVVRASVMNSASRAQPLPLLRVTLQDRFGNRIAARDVPPRDYLPSAVAPGALLAAGDRVDATMVFVDPGPQAEGFEIDACLQQQGGHVTCAHGP